MVGLRLRLPAGHVLGPILPSGAACGRADAIGAAGVVGGGGAGGDRHPLGVRFAGMPKRRILHALGLALMNGTLTIGGAAVVALLIAGWVGEPARAVFPPSRRAGWSRWG